MLAPFLLVLVVTACDSNRYFEENVSIPNATWQAENSLEFKPTINSKATPFNCFVTLRNSGDYSYSNLFLFLEITNPKGKIARDTLELFLADRTGKWLGSGLGDLYYNKVLFKKQVLFEDTGTYTFRFEQGMRSTQIMGITDFGLRIETAQ